MSSSWGRAASRAAALALCVASAACGSREPPPAVRAPEPARAVQHQAPEALLRWLELQAVHGDTAGRRVLYTWTTAAQVEESAKTGRLLTRVDGANGQRSALAGDAAAKEHLGAARVIALPAFERRRFAWPTPWATSLGFGDERYGDRLVRVVLKKDSVIWVFGPADNGFVDVEGKAVNEFEALRHVSRLAAVYHVGATDPNKPPTSFREFAIINEAQIEDWSVGTPAILERLALDAAMLHVVGKELAAVRIPDVTFWSIAVRDGGWRTGARTDDALRRYESSLAFLTDAYRPSATTAEAIARRLETLPPQGEPIVRAPNVGFRDDELLPRSGDPRPICVHQGSRCLPIQP